MLISTFCSIIAKTLHIGNGFPYANLEQAADEAVAGDSLLLYDGTHTGGQYIFELQGIAEAWIYIQNAEGEAPIIEGGGTAIQFVDPAYLHISGLTFQHQNLNGVNTDDGGDYTTPAHHIVFKNCTFRDMSANGNNDLLKLSGLDFFEVRGCTFLNGAEGGSAIDMVGCHNGLIKGNYFENMGASGIQAKGGTEHIRIEGNFFRNAGLRSLNLGGSTGLQFFRPLDAPFEAANLQVYSNIFVGSWAAVAYVGSVNVEVVNNTIFHPQNWVIRILQESVDADRFQECGDNVFRNNIVVLDKGLSTETNIGPNTRPETFTFSNNLWFNVDEPNWSGPNIPVEDLNHTLNQDPLFVAPNQDDFTIPENSPANGKGFPVEEPTLDYWGNAFVNPPSIGAIEANPMVGLENWSTMAASSFRLFPNPTKGKANIQFSLPSLSDVRVRIYNQLGQEIHHSFYPNQVKGFFETQLDLGLRLEAELYFVRVDFNEGSFWGKGLMMR